MKALEVAHAIEELAPRQYQESYDNAGWICGEPDTDVTQVLCALDCTELVVQEAISKGCEMIIAHHPIVFKGLKSITGKSYVERTVMLAIRHRIVIYAAHTNLDHAWNGVNQKIAQKLGLEQVKMLAPKEDVLFKLYTFVPTAALEQVRQAMFEAGAGHIGAYDHCSYSHSGEGTFRAGEGSSPAVGDIGADHTEPEIKLEVIVPMHRREAVLHALIGAHPYEEVAYDMMHLENTHSRLGSGMVGHLPQPIDIKAFMEAVSKAFHLKIIRHTANHDRPIQKIAVCGGAGSFLLPHAIAQKADVFITSDVKYHEFFDAEEKIVLLDIGHFESEQFTPELLKEYLEEKFPTFAVLLSEVLTNPVHYYIS